MSQANGKVTSGLVQLVNFLPIEKGAGGLATAETARQWKLLTDAFVAALGVVLVASEGYRDLARQKQLYAAYLAGSGVLAAYPGTSNHGLGTAIDVGSNVGVRTSAAAKWMDQHAWAYGFVNDVASEHWHWHYVGGATITTASATTTPAASAALTSEGDDDMSAQDITDIKAALGNLTNIVAQIANAVTDPGNGIQKNAATAAGKSTDTYNVLQNVQNLIVDTDNRVTAIQKKVGA